MQYVEQPTPPFNSPYQMHVLRVDSLLEPPFPSANRDEPMVQGLGLYNYHHQAPSTLPSSPSPSDCWPGHVSAGTSPLMTHALADPYASGAFDHPISRSPQPWSAQFSPRSSVSSVPMTPVYSQAGSDHAYHDMNHGWGSDTRYGHNGSALPSSRQNPSTVSPERLDGTLLSYDNTYGTTQITRLEPTNAQVYQNNPYGRGSRESSAGSPTNSRVAKRRRSPAKANASKSPIQCHECGRGFARQYNQKQHLDTHNKNRKKEHVCHFADCGWAFVRKTDLNRHNISVHKKDKDHGCSMCVAVFSRKDTCIRHQQDGCFQRKALSAERARQYHSQQGGHYAARL